MYNHVKNQPDSNINLSLDNIIQACHIYNNPHIVLSESSLIIHIAGTNGKGSVLYFLEQLLNNSFNNISTQMNIASFTSPHLFSINERFRLNGQCIELDNNIYQEIQSIDYLSYFEKLTLQAFIEFNKIQADICLFETGLGGRLDATNILNSDISIITNIGLDHEEYLGNTLHQIAYEKAGILKPNMPYITHSLNPAITKYAQDINSHKCPLVDITDNIKRFYNLNKLPRFQQDNFQLAYTAYQYVIQQQKFRHLAQTESQYNIQLLPGRMQYIQYNNYNILLDGSHNIDGITALYNNINISEYSIIIIGFSINKKWQNIIDILLQNYTGHIICTFASNIENSINPHTIEQYICQNHKTIQSCKCLEHEEIPEAIQANTLICGSLYLIGNLLQTFEHKINTV